MTASSSHAVLPLTLVAGSMVLAVAACGGTAGATNPPTAAGSTVTVTAAAPSATAGTTGASTAPAGATPSPSTSAGGAGAGGCGLDQLRVTYADDAGGAGAGSVMGRLTFTNTGASACTLRGFPGVSYVAGAQGAQVGQPATRTGDTARTKTLAPGARATAALRRSQPGPYGDSCGQTKVAGLRVYPPGSTKAAYVPFATTGCRSTSAPLLQVAPVR